MEQTVLWTDLAEKSIRHAPHASFVPAACFYGREGEQALIAEIYGRVLAGGREMLLVSGYTGIGKSSLVLRQSDHLFHDTARFIYGKCDQRDKNVPYSAFIGAFQDLITGLLRGSPTERARWKERLLTALAPNAQVIVRVLPALESLIGRQPELAEVGPLENRNRFHLYFQKFWDAIADSDRPFVVFIDDLQWADLASLSLLKTLTASAETGSFLLIGAYRDNEVGEKHPLSLTLREIALQDIPINRITLGPLDPTALSRMIEDAFALDPGQSLAAARVIYEKTGGNPFFINQFLESSLRDGIIRFTPKGRPAEAGKGGKAWRWDLNALMRQQATENIADSLKTKVDQFTDAEQKTIKLAACLGSKFDLETLALVNDRPKHEAFHDLTPFIQERLLFFVCGNYYFIHDKIRDAVYSLISEEERRETHFRIGERLLRDTPPSDLPRCLFFLTDQLNAAGELSASRLGKGKLAELNQAAGAMAKESCAYDSAFRYFSSAIRLLGSDAWSDRYEMVLALHTQAAEAASLSGDFARLDELVKIVFQRAANFLDQIAMHEVVIKSYIAQNKLPEAAATSRRVLRRLGIRLPAKPTKLDFILTGLKLKFRLARRKLDELDRLPEMSDARHLAAAKIMLIAASTFYYTSPELLGVMVLKFFELTLKFGRTSDAPLGYIGIASILVGIFWDIPLGYRFAELALAQIRKNKSPAHLAKVVVLFNVCIRPWREHLRKGLAPLLDGYRRGLETGDFEYAAFCMIGYLTFSYFSGVPLPRIYEETEGFIIEIGRIRQPRQLNSMEIEKQFILALLGRPSGNYDENVMLRTLERTNDINGLIQLHSHKAFMHYLFYRYPEALVSILRAKKYSDLELENFYITIVCFYHALILIALYPGVRSFEKLKYARFIRRHERKLGRLASYSPSHAGNKYFILRAEHARIAGRAADAVRFYDEAIRLSRVHSFIHEEGLAHELKARFLLGRGEKTEAGKQLAAALRCYDKWGALAKTKHLEATYPDLLRAASAVKTAGRKTPARRSKASGRDA
jgi:predicted ATPase